MIKIVGDKTMKPVEDRTRIQEWDEWFESTGDEESIKGWRSVKSVFGLDPAALDRWATMIALSRLDRITKK